VAPLNEVRRARVAYTEALKTVMQAPDGNYEPGFTLPGQSRPPTPTEKQKRGEFERNNPLSLDEQVCRSRLFAFRLDSFQNPWKQWFENVELRKTIRQDVQRT
jgi:TBC1 domain family protein 5